jgi:hypothetical protein
MTPEERVLNAKGEDPEAALPAHIRVQIVIN